MRRRWLLVAGSITAASMVAACGRPASTLALDRPQVIQSPTGPGSMAPGLSVSPDGRVILSWLDANDPPQAALRFAELSGDTWSSARTVASGERFFVNWADVPSVQRIGGTLTAHWLEKNGSGSYDYVVRVRLSRDGGSSWSPPLTPHADATLGEHGFVSFFRRPDEEIGLVWLDGRNMSSGDDHAGGGGAMTLRAGAIDAEGNVAETLVDDRVCECCPTAAAQTDEGIVVAYRNRSDDEIRDIYVTRLVEGRWSDARPVARDGWKIAGCPVNGPAVAADGRTVVLAWFTGANDRPKVQAAFSRDAGKTFGAPILVSDEAPIGRVSTALLPDASALAGWIQSRESSAELRVRRVSSDGNAAESIVVARVSSGRDSGYPRLVRAGNQIVFAWTDSTHGVRRVRTALWTLQDVSSP
ncbi:MAG: hypothetical protein ACRD2X_04035 [Vicinamibacteraceae bacterium]